MGPPNSKQSSAYVPPQTEGNSTLLGGGVLPAADVRGDLNRTPATTVELRFNPVIGGNYHGYIVVTDNATNRQWVSEGGPDGVRSSGQLPGGYLTAGTLAKSPGERLGSKSAASFLTDIPADQVAKRLGRFSDNFSARRLAYQIPISEPAYPYAIATQEPPVHNSNYYIGAAWDDLRGEIPSLPRGVSAPGWGDHRRESP
ncbi:MAG: hypothetical protein JSR24_08395 [Proteobacteria bacterium]|nr:hypothetical protein [Pseudomonadota bacterium]